jgi:YVTN family beta-propeller protein
MVGRIARRALAATVLVATVLGGLAARQARSAAHAVVPARDVLLVGNSIAGTVSLVDAIDFKNLGEIDVVGDLPERLHDIERDPRWAAAYHDLKEKQRLKVLDPPSRDRFVDDLALSPDGTRLYVSRGQLGDVAAFDLAAKGHPMLWRTPVAGYKADHAALSEDGTRIVVSAMWADTVEMLDARTGAKLGSLPTGKQPHTIELSGKSGRIYSASVGRERDADKGARLVVADGKSLSVLTTYAFPSGIRPLVITPDEKVMYAQLSFLNGLVRFDLERGEITHTVDEPLSAFAKANYNSKSDYPHWSAHHGLALSGDGTKLCDAGTIDDTVSIVSTATMTVTTTIDVGTIPYWATTSADGKLCFVSNSGSNDVSVIDYETGRELARTPVGRFPQRSRVGRIPRAVLDGLVARPAR